MNDFSDRMQATTRRLVSRFSSKAALKRVSKGEFDPVAGEYSGSEPKEYDVEVTPRLAYDLSVIDGELVKQGDFRVFIADSPVVPTVADDEAKDTLIMGGVEYQIVSIEPKELPDNTVAGYWLQCRA